MSCATRVTRSDNTSATFSRVPFTRLSITTTRSPRAASCRTSSDPMNPAPPVTTTVERPTSGIRLLLSFVSIPPAHEPGRHPGHDGEGGDVLGDDGAGADDRAFPDGDARKQHGFDADVGPIADAHRLDAQVGLHERDVGWQPRVLRPQHFR